MIDLILISNKYIEIPIWKLGVVTQIEDDIKSLSVTISERITNSTAPHILFWDAKIPLPSDDLIQKLSKSVVDVHHAGLLLGTAGAPGVINYVHPTWMLNLDPDPKIEATSWRFSFRAALVRTDVFVQLGLPDIQYSSIDSGGIDIGYKWITRGVFMRHTPALLPEYRTGRKIQLPLADEINFIKKYFSAQWVSWVMFRLLLREPALAAKYLWSCRNKNSTEQFEGNYKFFHREEKPDRPLKNDYKVSVILATINRYDYLRVVLKQLTTQTVAPFEVIVIDQTPLTDRITQEEVCPSGLPTTWIVLDVIGQCSARNAGIFASQGDYLLFLDDDVEIEPDLIERHLRNLNISDASVSNGVANEVGIERLPYNFTYKKVSDVFPTNNTLISKKVLLKSGLFDLAYNGGEVEDADLGTRIYLVGERMVLDPSTSLLHYHAPQGGLRVNKARVNTHASSRQKVFIRVLPSVSNIYLARRYFSKKQVREYLILQLIGTFIVHGNISRKMMKVIYSLFLLPATIWQIRKRFLVVSERLKTYPEIPDLNLE